jgi:hypothetical protein
MLSSPGHCPSIKGTRFAVMKDSEIPIASQLAQCSGQGRQSAEKGSMGCDCLVYPSAVTRKTLGARSPTVGIVKGLEYESLRNDLSGGGFCTAEETRRRQLPPSHGMAE